MTIKKRIKPDNIEQLLKMSRSTGLDSIIEIIRDNKYKVRFVGGCVRNALIGEPINDIDLATEALPETLMDILSANKIKFILTGLKHGTITVVIGNNNFEITTLRTDIECNGRHASVEYTNDWKKDAFRRDFTFNAMYADINGTVYDYAGGMKDLEEGLLRFMGDPATRIREDYLRILRAFRFHLYVCTQAMPQSILTECEKEKDNLDKLSGERISAEMFKILTHPRCFTTIQIMEIIGILPKLFGECPKISYNSIRSIPGAETNKLATIIGSTSNPQRTLQFIKTRWKISNEVHTKLTSLALKRPRIRTDTELRDTVISIGKENFSQILTSEYLEGNYTEEQYNEVMQKCLTMESPEFPISGHDIISIGAPQGKGIKHILEICKQKWKSEGYTSTKQSLIEHARSIIKSMQK